MKNIGFVFVLFWITLSVQADDIEIEKGKALFHTENCAGCHFKSGSYSPLKSTATDFKEVRGWIKSCAQYFNIAWFPEEETATALYLNEIYYQYPLPKE